MVFGPLNRKSWVKIKKKDKILKTRQKCVVYIYFIYWNVIFALNFSKADTFSIVSNIISGLKYRFVMKFEENSNPFALTLTYKILSNKKII